jgi:hypothetical protein
MCKLGGTDAARQALHYVAPVGEKEAFIARTLAVVQPFVDATAG